MFDDAGIRPDNTIDISMVDLRYYKLFNLRYGNDSAVGKLMYDTQQHGFEKKWMGTMIGDNAANMLIGSSDANYPI